MSSFESRYLSYAALQYGVVSNPFTQPVAEPIRIPRTVAVEPTEITPNANGCYCASWEAEHGEPYQRPSDANGWRTYSTRPLCWTLDSSHTLVHNPKRVKGQIPLNAGVSIKDVENADQSAKDRKTRAIHNRQSAKARVTSRRKRREVSPEAKVKRVEGLKKAREARWARETFLPPSNPDFLTDSASLESATSNP
jgi:hypothetical protein